VSQENKLRVHLEFGEVKADFEGDANQVFESVVRFLTQIYPDFEVLSRMVYTPDLISLSQKLAGLVEITSDGPLLVSSLDLPARDAACIAILAAHVGTKLGKLSKGTLSSSDLAKMTGKARKTISNEMPRLLSEGIIQRTPEAEYQITELGIRKTEATIDGYKRSPT